MSLGFFSGDISSSESDGDENETVPKVEESIKPEPDNEDKLPSPDTLFATVGKPTFLNDYGHVHVDWDKYAKSLDPPVEENLHERGHYAAIPPPSSDTTEVSAPPVRYSPQPPASPENDGGPATTEEPSTGKRPSVDAESASKKKQKVETFRQKEKKKRDLGMSSRGKNYVEEEKRVLREQYGPLGVGD